jgi:hypothetical protein
MTNSRTVHEGARDIYRILSHFICRMRGIRHFAAVFGSGRTRLSNLPQKIPVAKTKKVPMVSKYLIRLGEVPQNESIFLIIYVIIPAAPNFLVFQPLSTIPYRNNYQDDA